MIKKQIAVIGLSGISIFLKIDHFHKAQETILSDAFHLEPGGKGYNQAIAISRFGGNVEYLSATGDDIFSDICQDTLTNNNINSALIKKKGKTALAAIQINKKGENRVTVALGSQLEKDDVDSFKVSIRKSEYLLLQFEVPYEVNKRAIEIAREYNVKVIINPAPMNVEYMDLIKDAWLITPNEYEAKEMFGLDLFSSIQDLKEAIIKSNFKQMVITLGEKGSLVYINQSFTMVPSMKVQSINTTGAGDIYNAGLIYALSAGKDLITACQYATVAAGLSVSKEYVLDSIPTWQEIEKTMH